MCETELSLAAFLFNFKNNIRIVPFGLVLDEVKVIMQNMPNNFLVRHMFGNFDRTAMDIFEVVIVHRTGFVRVTVNFFRPPCTNIIDSSKNFRRALVYSKGRGVIFVKGPGLWSSQYYSE